MVAIFTAHLYTVTLQQRPTAGHSMENTGKFDVPTTCFGRTVAGSIPDGVIEPPHYGAVVDSAPNIN